MSWRRTMAAGLAVFAFATIAAPVAPADASSLFGASQWLHPDRLSQPCIRAVVEHRHSGGRCGPGASYPAGIYGGTIEFHGEGGYADVSATSAPATGPESSCGVIVSTSSQRRAIALEVSGVAGDAVSLRAAKNHPKASVRVVASTLESAGDIGIFRSVRLRAPASALTCSRHCRSATVSLPAPFSGTAVLRGGFSHHSRWRGNLTLDLPGRPAIPLTGPRFHASLLHDAVTEIAA